MMPRLRNLWSRPVIRGISAMAFMRYTTKGLSLARLALVASFLDPADLGSFGLALLVIAVTEVFTETGINILLLKNEKKLDEYIDTAWGVSIVRGLIISALIWFATPWLTSFYRDPELISLLQIAALIPALRGFINPAIVQFQQRLEFEKESLLRIGLQLFDLAVGLWLAWMWQSAVGLLWGVVAAVIVEVAVSFVLFRLRPQLSKFRWSLVPKLYKETRVIIGNGIVNYLTENLDYFIVGRVLGTAGLGLYQTGFKVAGAVTIDFGSLMGQTLYPVYARLAGEKKPVTPLWRKSTLWLSIFYILLAVPMVIFLDPLIRFFFRREAWLEIIPLIRVLFFAGLMKSYVTSWNPLSILAGNLFHHIVMHVFTMIVLAIGIFMLAPGMGVLGAGWAVLGGYAIVLPYAWFVVRQALRRLDA